jgi:elongation factor G
MKEFTSGDIRNFAVVGHGATGKTVLCEAMLSCAGEINRMGSIEDQNTISDYHHDEHERQISIHSYGMNKQHAQHRINIIDTPGHVDFTIEVERSLRVLDGAVTVFCAVGGVEPQTEPAL